MYFIRGLRPLEQQGDRTIALGTPTRTLFMPEDPESLESALEALEQLVKAMESDDLPLEALIAKYESGVKLTKFCRERLTDAERRIEIISRDSTGKVTLEEFDTGSNE